MTQGRPSSYHLRRKMSSYEGAFSYSFRILRGLGLWNYESDNHRKVKLYNRYRCVALVYLFIITLLPCIDFFLSLDDVRKWSFNLFFTITIVSTFFKTSGLLWNMDGINSLRKDLDRNLSMESRENRKILEAAAKEVKTLLKTLLTMGYIIFLVWMSIPFSVTDERKLPLQMWVPFDPQVSPNYQIVYSFHFAVGFFLVMTIFGTNFTMVGFTIRICAEYDILKNDIVQFSQQFEDSVPVQEEEMANQFRDIIRHHQRIIGFVERLTSCYHHLLVVQFIGSTALLMIIGLDIILISSTLSIRFILQIGYLFITLADLSLYCVSCTRLIQKSEELANVVFGVQWYAMIPAYRRGFAYLIQRSQKCPRVVLGCMYTINLNLYLEILKVTYNILAVMYQVTSSA